MPLRKKKKAAGNPNLGGANPRKEQCGYPIKNGEAAVCRQPKITGQERCRLHLQQVLERKEEEAKRAKEIKQLEGNALYEPPPEYVVESFDDYNRMVTDIINRVVQARLPGRVGNNLSFLFRELHKGMTAKRKFDPQEIGKREIATELAAKLIRDMPIEEVKRLTANRDFRGLEEQLTITVQAPESTDAEPSIPETVKALNQCLATPETIAVELISDATEDEFLGDALE